MEGAIMLHSFFIRFPKEIVGVYAQITIAYLFLQFNTS